MKNMWLREYASTVGTNDQLKGKPSHKELLIAGLYGEIGSVLAEIKKRQREVLPANRHRIREEMGDVLWYLTRVTQELCPTALQGLGEVAESLSAGNELAQALRLGEAAGELSRIRREAGVDGCEVVNEAIRAVWLEFMALISACDLKIDDVVAFNMTKIASRWPEDKEYMPLFDDNALDIEQLPRRLTIEFRRMPRAGKSEMVVLRCNGLNFGDRLTDNIGEPDAYRFHDVFHFAWAVHLGWSPVLRALLKCKRKSNSSTDENEDGARAGIVEEAVTALVFSRAKLLNFYDGIHQIDYDILKMVHEIVRGYEVERIPLWQWEKAILEGFRLFRVLRTYGGGFIKIDLERREMLYSAPEGS